MSEDSFSMDEDAPFSDYANSEAMDDADDDLTDDGDVGFVPIGPTDKGKKKSYEVDYTILSMDDIVRSQQTEIDHVAGIAGIKPTEAGILLRHYGWNKEKLVEKYMSEPEKVFLEAGIYTDVRTQPKLKRAKGFTCGVCFEADDSKDTIALSCGHRFCAPCYGMYLEQKIVGEGESRRIQCMDTDCGLVVDEKTIALLVTDKVLVRYRRLLNRTYVDDDPTLCWCPAPDCEHAVRCSVPHRSLNSIVPTVRCACGTPFCFGCGRANHQPCICPIVRLWLKKCEDDSETANWINANTKECPKCYSTIEKNGGCNHMTCKKCKYEFCWVCMGNWTEHGTNWYNCNRFDDKGEGKDAQSSARVALERYLHYYNRYANHEQSAKLEKDVYARIEKKMDEMQKSSELSWIEVQFLRKAVDTLGECRATLKWTYSLAYYLKRDNHTAMFEDNQSDLEMAVEALSELLEKPIDAETIPELRQMTTDKTVYVQKRNEILLTDTAQGFEEGRWTFTVPVEA